MPRRGNLTREPSLCGVSVVALCGRHSEHQETSNRNNSRSNSNSPGCLLLLGTLDNALAAAAAAASTQQLDNGRYVQITHIVSVADNSKAAQVRKVISKNDKSSIVHLSCHYMADRLPMEEVVDIQRITAAPLLAIEQAVGFSMSDTCAREPPSPPFGEDTVAQRSVLVHCNQGFNRSPTLVLTYLLRTGLSLRDSYKLLLRSRSSVDPLPPYRRALRDYECSLSGEATVQEEEVFQLHFAELGALVKRENQEREGSGNNVKDSVDLALELRNKSISRLLGLDGVKE